MSGDWPHGYGYLPLGEVTSTLDEARARVGEMSGPTWITATHQTAARGRRGRPWSNPAGNFAGTLVLPNLTDPASAALRSFTTALALDEALTTLTGRPEAFALKWPNDVLLNGSKLAGILLESLTERGHLTGLVIGIGVNLVTARNGIVLRRLGGRSDLVIHRLPTPCSATATRRRRGASA